ncbi:NHL repeat-containing protein [Actinokineospora bangkokensis]|uniref:Fibronectin type-III domain-containing protein n=1 Tax=Actinokineospora bangkokensis TaxID=1193682 RepID=A0A1Q9LTT6_9PSEU|nr:hypothetical protein [Actinokineospora bangkokensis]OLR95452.1 hypothetical protein BJP25_06835 [Actinokineospora bangkokensis]
MTRRIFSRQGRARESASFGAAALGALLLAGAVLGTGIARTEVQVSDGLTWVGDDQRGEVVQVNPASGRPETRLQVAGGDAVLDITQRDGRLVVLDRRTGQITVVDLATLLASGRRQAAPGAGSKVLAAAGLLYVVDRDEGVVVDVDPVTLVDVGAPWRAGRPLADAVADDDGVLWAVDHGGTLRALGWDGAAARFVERSAEQVAGAGPATVLVPHRRGVTLLGLEGGVVLQAGTGEDRRGRTDQRTGTVLAAQASPSGLVPAAVPDAGVVVLLSGPDVLQVDVRGRGCPHPDRPAVLKDKVYVPCRGDGKVIVLDPRGGRGGADLETPGSPNPQLVLDDDRIVVNAPGAEKGLVIDPDGSAKPVTIRNPDLPVKKPEKPPVPPTPPSPPPPDPDEPTRTRPHQPTAPPVVPVDGQPGGGVPAGPPSGPGVPSSGPGGSTAPSAGARVPGAPAGVTATEVSWSTRTTVSVSTTWTAPASNGSPITGYRVKAQCEGGAYSLQDTVGTSLVLAVECSEGGRVTVTVVASNAVGSGPAGSASVALSGGGGNPPVTTQPPPPPPVTTTEPPPPPPPTTTTEPPLPAMPTPGATVITGSVRGADVTERLLKLEPPADWASFPGTCVVRNSSAGYDTPIGCADTSATIYGEYGANVVTVVATAADGRTSVSKAHTFTVREPVGCSPSPCQIPASYEEPVSSSPTTSEATRTTMAAAGVGLLLTAVVVRATGRRREDTADGRGQDEENDTP